MVQNDATEKKAINRWEPSAIPWVTWCWSVHLDKAHDEFEDRCEESRGNRNAVVLQVASQVKDGDQAEEGEDATSKRWEASPWPVEAHIVIDRKVKVCEEHKVTLQQETTRFLS